MTKADFRILWIGKSPSGSGAGDEIYDRKIISGLRAGGATVEIHSPKRVGSLHEAVNLARGVPHYRSWYASRANAAALQAAAREADVVVSSWEPFDRLAFRLARPVIPILHNVTSQALAAIRPGHAGVGLLAYRAGLWERRAYRAGRFAAIGTLARDDIDYLRVRVAVDPDRMLYLPPGMPPVAPLIDGARFRPELLISGTFAWMPKGRDVLAFAEDAATHPAFMPIFADNLPPHAESLLRPRPLDEAAHGSGIRLGLIPDRFKAGHKLKTTYYIANNAIVLTYADIRGDFRDIPDCDLFIRLIGRAADVAAIAAEFARMDPIELERRFRAFKAACAERFDWSKSAADLLRAAERARAAA